MLARAVGRRRFLTPVPVADSFESLNAKLEANCLAELNRKVSGHSETIGRRLEADLSTFRVLPSGAFEACEKRAGRVSSTALVRYRGSDYSVPTTYGYRDVIVKGFVDQVIIICDGEEIAQHKRSYERGAFVCDPLHYSALIEQKPNALDQARPLQGRPCPTNSTTSAAFSKPDGQPRQARVRPEPAPRADGSSPADGGVRAGPGC